MATSPSGERVKRVAGVGARSRSSWLAVIFFLPLVLTLFCTTVGVALHADLDRGLWLDPVAPAALLLGTICFGALLVMVSFRTLQVFGVLGVVYLRGFDDGSALVGSWWLVRRGRGLTVDRTTTVEVDVVETMPKVLGWRSDTGIPVYMAWTLSAGRRGVGWLTPFAAAPDAAERLAAALSQLPEPAFASLRASQAARAGGS